MLDAHFLLLETLYTRQLPTTTHTHGTERRVRLSHEAFAFVDQITTSHPHDVDILRTLTSTIYAALELYVDEDIPQDQALAQACVLSAVASSWRPMNEEERGQGILEFEDALTSMLHKPSLSGLHELVFHAIFASFPTPPAHEDVPRV